MNSEQQATINSHHIPHTMVRPDLLGFSAHLTWLCLFVYKLVPAATTAQVTGHEALDPAYLASMFALVATLLVGIAFTRPFVQAARSKVAAYAAPLACSLGTVMGYVAIGDASATGPAALIVASGLLTGIGSAVMAVSWAGVFGQAKTRHVVNNFTLILVIVVCACLTTTYLSDATAAIASLLPLVSGACLSYAHRYQASHPVPATGRSSTRRARKVYTALIVLVAVFGLSTGALTNLGTADHSLQQFFYLLAAIIALVFVGRLIFTGDRYEFLCLFVVPLVVLLVVCVPYLKYISTDGSGVFLQIGSVAVELLLLFVSVLFALLFDFSPARTFMVVRATTAISDLAGAMIGDALIAQVGDSAGMQLAGMALLVGAEIVVAAIAGSYVLLSRKTPSLTAFNTEAAGFAAPPQTEQPVQQPAAETEEATGAATGLAAAVDALALEHGLSPRETDVLRLLAQGKTTSQIQEELFIAQGTLNYHMRNVYAKFDTHSRQELLVKIYSATNKQ